MKNLIIPERVEIEIVDNNNEAIKEENILVGIHTYATRKNNIDIFPFLSDGNGKISITKDQINTRVDNFVQYSLMEFISLEYANPKIRIYFLGNDNLDNCIKWLKKILHDKEQRRYIDKMYSFKDKYNTPINETEIGEKDDLKLFETCFNRKTEIRNNIILVEDIWDEPSSEKKYLVKLTP